MKFAVVSSRVIVRQSGGCDGRQGLQNHRVGGRQPEVVGEGSSNAVEVAAQSLQDLRIAEVVELDMQVEEGKVLAYRARIKLSFKYHTDND